MNKKDFDEYEKILYNEEMQDLLMMGMIDTFIDGINSDDIQRNIRKVLEYEIKKIIHDKKYPNCLKAHDCKNYPKCCDECGVNKNNYFEQKNKETEIKEGYCGLNEQNTHTNREV